jgi:exodeoxyribonuclease VII large subunit
MRPEPITVSKLTDYISGLIGEDPFLSRIYVRGEVSNVKYHSRGHVYFTLKDENSQLGGVMWRSRVPVGLKFDLQNGDKVVVSGKIRVYNAGGYYQIVADSIEADGMGILYQRFLKLKEELSGLGWFDPAVKKPIPKYVNRIGVVTSPTGAAVRDIISISKKRNPYIQIILYPALVQGRDAAESIVDGIKILDEMHLDVIIVGRGGGSMEDLFAFNEKSVAEAIFNARTPVVSAVGHETDVTIADFVADKRAATPSNAAEISVDLFSEKEERYERDRDRLCSEMDEIIRRYRYKLSVDVEKLKAASPEHRLLNMKSDLKNKDERLTSIIVHKIESSRMVLSGLDKIDDIMKLSLERSRQKLSLLSGRLDALSPMKKLKSGYAYTEDMEGRHIMSVSELSPGDKFNMFLKDGIVKSDVISIELENMEERSQNG